MKIIRVHGCSGDCPFVKRKRKEYFCEISDKKLDKEHIDDYDYVPNWCCLEDLKE